MTTNKNDALLHQQETTAALPAAHLSSAAGLEDVEVVESGTSLGRVVVAKKDFSIGDVVISEAPLLIWENQHASHDRDGFLRAFCSSDSETQNKVLNMHHQSLSSASLLQRQIAHRLMKTHASDLSRGDMSSEDVALTLVLVIDCNAHEFRGKSGDSMVGEKVVAHLMDCQQVPRSALFDVGSKVEHSCWPNTKYSSSSDTLKYTATREIKAGDHVSFSYLADDFGQPLIKRREMLLDSKFFLCCCARCTTPDYSRPLQGQPGTACGGHVFLFTSALSDPTVSDVYSAKRAVSEDRGAWRCACCPTNPFRPTVEDVVSLQAFEATLVAESELFRHITQVRPGMLQQAKRLQQRVMAGLSPMHYLNAFMLGEIAKLAASEAVMFDHAPPALIRRLIGARGIQGLRFQSGVALAQLVIYRECMEAVLENRLDIPGAVALTKTLYRRVSNGDLSDAWVGTGSVLRPSQNSASVKDAFYAGEDLLQAERASAAAGIWKRYEVLISTWLPADDYDARMEKLRCVVATPLARASTPSSGCSISTAAAGLALTDSDSYLLQNHQPQATKRKGGHHATKKKKKGNKKKNSKKHS